MLKNEFKIKKMPKREKKGKFIVLEGIDGSGKDALIGALLAKIKKIRSLNENSKENSKSWLLLDNHSTFEPNNSPYASKIRHYLVNEETNKDNKLLMKWFIADRKWHMQEIKAKLANENVFCIRYDLSTYAYQSENRDLLSSFTEIYASHQYYSEGYCSEGGCLIPDVTFFLDLDIDLALERIKQRNGERGYYEKRNFLEQIKEKYLKAIDFLRKKDQRKIIVLNSLLETKNMANLAWEYLDSEL